MADTKKMGYDPSRDEEYQKALQAMHQAREDKPVYANTYGAAAPAVPVKDTIKTVQGGVVINTPDRAALQAVQTPQVFDIDLIRGALKQAIDEDAPITDDCSAVERLGMSVKIVEGDERNIKVTTPMDLKIAEMLLEEMK